MLLDKLFILFETDAVLSHIERMRNSDIAEMPWFILYLGYIALALRVSENEAVLPAVSVEP